MSKIEFETLKNPLFDGKLLEAFCASLSAPREPSYTREYVADASFEFTPY